VPVSIVYATVFTLLLLSLVIGILITVTVKLTFRVSLFMHAVPDSTAIHTVFSLLLSLSCPLGVNIIGLVSTAWCLYMLLYYPSLTKPRWFSRDPPESPRHPPATGSALNGASPRYLHPVPSRLRERSRGLKLLLPNILLSTLLSLPSVYVLPLMSETKIHIHKNGRHNCVSVFIIFFALDIHYPDNCIKISLFPSKQML